LRLLTAADVRAALPMNDAINAVREGFVALSTGRATVLLRSAMPIPEGTMLYMPAYIDGSPVSTVKVVGVFPGNPAHNLSTVVASVLVLDAQTGVPLALMDGTALTAIRTGAASGLATDLLAKRDATVLAVIGSGAQARTQIEAVCAVRPIREIRIFSPNNAQKLADELRASYQARIIVSSDAHEAMDGADVVVAATTSSTPVVNGGDVARGAHINGIGSYKPEMQEVASDVVAASKLVVDHRDSAWAEAGDLIVARNLYVIQESSIHAEIGEIAAGLKPGRESDDEITFFKSVGNAVQDAACARHVFETAEAQGLGTVATL
jgi:ornithine cyclodeaminase/alanine dehydrogenase-like protein (mu-crystallin family)